jgi:hypothetical protein
MDEAKAREIAQEWLRASDENVDRSDDWITANALISLVPSVQQWGIVREAEARPALPAGGEWIEPELVILGGEVLYRVQARRNARGELEIVVRRVPRRGLRLTIVERRTSESEGERRYRRWEFNSRAGDAFAIESDRVLNGARPKREELLGDAIADQLEWRYGDDD